MNQLSWTNFNIKHGSDNSILYCLPYAGGGANMFRSWALRAKEDNIEIKALSMPGRESKFKVPPYVEYKKILHDLFELMKQEPQKPCSFFGYSLGALLAFDLTIMSKKNATTQIRNLFFAGMSAPHVLHGQKKYDELTDDQLITDLLSDPDNLTRQSPDLIQLQRLLLPTLRADHKLYETYQFDHIPEKFNYPIYLFAGKSDFEHDKNISAWQDLFENQIEILWYEGEHMFLHRHQDAILQFIINKIKQNN